MMSCSEWTLRRGRGGEHASPEFSFCQCRGGRGGWWGELRSWEARSVSILAPGRYLHILTRAAGADKHPRYSGPWSPAQPSIATMVNRWTGAWLGWAGLGWLGWAGLVCGRSDTTGGGRTHGAALSSALATSRHTTSPQICPPLQQAVAPKM